MKNRANKIYNKAINYYQKGKFYKALHICEKDISNDLTNKDLINLNGLLLYLNGNLNEAITLWNINRDYNNDEMSKIYIRDSKEEEKRLDIYNSAEKDISELNIDEAIEKLMNCAKSDFNTINVNNALARCYIKKGNYDLAIKANERVLSINSKNNDALHIKKELQTIIKNPRSEFTKKTIVLAICIALLTSIFIGFKNLNIWELEQKKDIPIADKKEESIKEINKTVEDKTPTNIPESVTENLAEDIKIEEVSLTDDEVVKIYESGRDYFDKKEYKNSIDTLITGINNKNEHYLNQHILFFLAASYENDNMIEDGIKYYEDYVSKYKDGSYIEEAYYKLAILYKKINRNEKSKEYAGIIVNNYPKSMYNNEVIKEITAN